MPAEYLIKVVTHQDLTQAARTIAEAVQAKGFDKECDLLVAINRDGYVLGKELTRFLDGLGIPLARLTYHRERDNRTLINSQSDLELIQQAKKPLVVAGWVYSGLSLRRACNTTLPSNDVLPIATACAYLSERAQFAPNIVAETIPNRLTIAYPWEDLSKIQPRYPLPGLKGTHVITSTSAMPL